MYTQLKSFRRTMTALRRPSAFGTIAFTALCIQLSACSTPQVAKSKENNSTKITSAATAPLSDLNLLKTKIAPVLLNAHKSPYGDASTMSCEQIAEEINALDDVLGDDLDAPNLNKNLSIFERGAGQASNAAIGAASDAIRRTTEGVIPFRSWIRKLTGAEEHSREIMACIASGIVRRAYLKGIGQKSSCSAPAAPLPPAVTVATSTTPASATPTATPIFDDSK